MSPSNSRSSSRKPAPGDRQKRRSALDAGFERWLNTQLHKMYDPVLDERVPDELSRLLEAFDESPADESPADESPADGSQADKSPAGKKTPPGKDPPER